MTPEVRQTIRQAGGVALLRVIEVLGGVLLLAFVPRLMGPAIYGQFSLIFTVSLWFSLLNGMASDSVMTRFVPGFMEHDDHAGLRKLVSGMLALRLWGGLTAAIAYCFLVILWLPDVGALSIVLIAACLFVRSVANLPFTVLLGMNRAAQWSAAEALRRGLIAPAAFLGFSWHGLVGACWGLLVTELLVMALGLWWGRSSLAWSDLRVNQTYLRPYLRFSAAFLAGKVIITMYVFIGGPLVQLLSGEFAEVAFYSIAFGVYLTGLNALSTMLSALGPMLSSLRLRGEQQRLKLYVERFLTVSGILSVVAAATAYCFSGSVVRVVLGSGYGPVVPLVELLSIAGIFVSPGELARVLAVVDNRPRISIVGAAIQLAVFVSLTLVLFPFSANSGVAIAVIVATAAFSGYSTWALAQHLPYSMNPWLKIVAIGAVYSPLLWAWNAHTGLRWAAFHALFLSSVFLLRILKLGDLTGSWDAIRAAMGGPRI